MNTHKRYFLKAAAALAVLFLSIAPLSAMGGKETAQAEAKMHYEHGSHYRTEIDYPLFEAEPVLNKMLIKKVHDTVTTFHNEWFAAQEAVSAEGAGIDTARGFELSMGVNEVHEDMSMLSFFLSCYEYTGGAHGSTVLIPFNYSKNTKKLITLKQAFEQFGCLPDEWLSLLADEVRRQLLEQVQQGVFDSEAKWIKEGTEPVEKNFSTFTIEGDNIRIVFAQYQVAPYASGMPEVKIPRDFFKL